MTWWVELVSDSAVRGGMRWRDRVFRGWEASWIAPWQPLAITLLALMTRLTVVAWGVGKFPPTADGVYYETLARRIASGAGYTWLWPDGVVTPAAHYPVGYPALLSLGHLLAGGGSTVAALINAMIGALGVWAIHGMVSRSVGSRAALVAGVLAAIDPALVLYTPAIMTEGVTAALLACAGFSAAVGNTAPARVWRFAALTGVILGVATLVRPQSLLLAPLFGAVAVATSFGDTSLARWVQRAVAALITTALCIAVCLPWTARNCVEMKRCALVSVNGGWNLLIGTNPAAEGHWAGIDVPPECREVFDEAGKDVCFSNAARREILEHPASWLRLIPPKLGATFDGAVAAPWYLHAANATAFPESSKHDAQVVEIGFHRILLAITLVLLVARRPLPIVPTSSRAWPSIVAVIRSPDVTSRVIAFCGFFFCFEHRGWIAYMALGLAMLLLGLEPMLSSPLDLPVRPRGPGGHTSASAAEKSLNYLAFPPLSWLTAAVILGTALVHAVFFGAGRYSLVILPFVTACAGALLTSEPVRSDSASPQPAGLPPRA